MYNKEGSSTTFLPFYFEKSFYNQLVSLFRSSPESYSYDVVPLSLSLPEDSNMSSTKGRFFTAFSITVKEHDWHEHICSQMSQHTCCPVLVLWTLLNSSSERNGFRNCSLLHSVDFKKSLMSWSTFLNWCPWNNKMAHECCPSRPTRPVSCKKSTALFGGPYMNTLCHEATLTPIPNALVATTMRNRLSLVKYSMAFFFSSDVSEWYISICSSILGMSDSSVTRKL